MTQTKVADLTVDELKGLIKEVVTQALSEVLSDPDEGLELRPEAADQLRRSLTAMKAGTRQPRQPGSAKGKLLLLAEDEAHLEDFREYMPARSRGTTADDPVQDPRVAE